MSTKRSTASSSASATAAVAGPEPGAGRHSPPPAGGSEVTTLIDRLLEEQRQLTAVDRFARRGNPGEPAEPDRTYRDLIPLHAPRPGEQYAFEVDLDRCSSCKACVAACHSLNGLDDGESWRDVGLLTGVEPLRAPPAPAPSPEVEFDRARIIPLQQTVTTACHHCVEPGCLQGCPVLAYDKDPATGIVRHLDDQCIGCSYCILKCPYEVPRYSSSRGIVRKCDMCHGRLAAGEAPACVQACPDQAIRITVVYQQDLLNTWRPASRAVPAHRRENERRPTDREWLPDSPPADLTVPATRYLTRRNGASLKAADHAQPRLEPAHWPLAWMLVLTQAGAGLLLGGFFTLVQGVGAMARPQTALGWGLLQLGLIAAAFHLGQPLRAWRAFLGWRTSWLSREILAFSALAGAATALAGAAWLSDRIPVLAGTVPFWWTLAAAAGLIAVFASAMVYIDTGRLAWNRPDTLHAFFGTTFLLGASANAALAFQMAHAGDPALLPVAQAFACIAVVVRTVLYLSGWLSRRMARSNPAEPLHASARVLDRHLAWVEPVRAWIFAIAIVAGVASLVGSTGTAAGWAIASLVANACGEVLERHVFFVTAAPWRMPGLPT